MDLLEHEDLLVSSTPATGSDETLTLDPVAAVLNDEEPVNGPPKGPPQPNATVTATSVPEEPFDVSQDINEQLAALLLSHSLPQSLISALQAILRQNASLTEKNTKLKSLLGRSAKVQRDLKTELEHAAQRWKETSVEKDRLERRLDRLMERPTQWEMVLDFETQLDRALVAIGQPDDEDVDSIHDNLEIQQQQQQSGGENAKEDTDTTNHQELKNAISQLSHLQSRNSHLEQSHQSLLHELHMAKNTTSNLTLELRMSQMETDHALRSLREKEALLAEMQLEIHLVTNSAVEANKRAREGREVVHALQKDKEYVEGLEAKVAALQEWALASAESKRLTVERCRGLEERVRVLEERKNHENEGADWEGGNLSESTPSVDTNNNNNNNSNNHHNSNDRLTPLRERKLWTKSSSLVIGAGMTGHAFLELDSQQHPMEPIETCLLRWKFDVTPSDMDIYFSVLKGICADRKTQRGADACFRNRHVLGGGGGEISGAFAIQNACTLLWSNEMSWVRPRTIKWTVDAMAIEWRDEE